MTLIWIAVGAVGGAVGTYIVISILTRDAIGRMFGW